MRSFEEQFYLENPTRLQILIRNIRLLGWLIVRLYIWLTKGASVRRAYRLAKKTSAPVVLEHQIPD